VLRLLVVVAEAVVAAAAAAQRQLQRCSLLAISTISKFVVRILVLIASVLIVSTRSFGSIIGYLH
jgi:hypothetical protein